jgi:hypothetical protein
MYDLPYIPTNHGYVKMLEELPADPELDRVEPTSGPAGGRTGRAYLIYPYTADETTGWIEWSTWSTPATPSPPSWHSAPLMQEPFPGGRFPRLRCAGPRQNRTFRSPQHGHDTCSSSVSGLKRHDWDRFLRAVDHTLRRWAPPTAFGRGRLPSTVSGRVWCIPSSSSFLPCGGIWTRMACFSTTTSVRL